MAKNDVKIVDKGGYLNIPTRNFPVQDRTSSGDTIIYPGDPVKILAGQSGNYVGHLATGDPQIGTDIVVGIAASTSTEESVTTDGTVNVYMPLPGVVYRCNAHTVGNIDTTAKLLALNFDCVTFDLTSTTFTVNEDEGSDENVHGLRIVGGNITAGTIDFTINPRCTILGDLNA